MAKKYAEPDFWSQKAFSEGYPARSVYKLAEMDEKFSLLSRGLKALDLGASPGSWTKFVLEKVGAAGSVVAVDLNDLAKSVNAPNLTFILGDLRADNVRNEALAKSPFDIVLCDAAPLTSGNRIVDTARSAALVETAVFYAKSALKSGGNFVAKLFQGAGQDGILADVRSAFKSARTFKPAACRRESFETYIVGLGKI